MWTESCRTRPWSQTMSEFWWNFFFIQSQLKKQKQNNITPLKENAHFPLNLLNCTNRIKKNTIFVLTISTGQTSLFLHNYRSHDPFISMQRLPAKQEPHAASRNFIQRLFSMLHPSASPSELPPMWPHPHSLCSDPLTPDRYSQQTLASD